MLKIKDNINLVKLEKLGFTADGNDQYSITMNGVWVGIGVNRELIIDMQDWCIDESVENLSNLIYYLTDFGFLEQDVI